MAKKVTEKFASGTGRGNVPVGEFGIRITVNMGDYNSVQLSGGLSNIDVSSLKATKKEVEQAGPCLVEIAAVVDEKTGEMLEAAIGKEAADEIQMRMLRAIAEAMTSNHGGKK